MDESTPKSLSWNEDTDYALGVYRLIGHSLGIWPLTCHEFGSKIIFFIVILLQLNAAYNLIREFVSGCVTIDDGVEIVSLLAAAIVCLLKVSVIRVHRKDMCRIVESAAKDWAIVRDEKSRDLMRKYAYRGRLISIFLLSIGLSAIAPLVLYSPPTLGQIIDDGLETSNTSVVEMRNLPMGTGCSVVDLPTIRYLAFYILQCIQFLYIPFCNVGCDAVFFGIGIHLCAQFNLLKIDMAGLGRHLDERDVGEDMRAAIERHNHLLLLLDLVEDIFNVIIFGLLAATGVDIILLGLQILLALRDESFMGVVYASTGVTCLLLQLCAYCYVGDYLSSHADDLRTAAYSCNWYNFPSSLAKDVMFVIMKTSNAYQLTAGKVLPINMESFTSIVKTLASFFSFMKLTIVK